MASKRSSRRWIILGLVALGVVVVATLPRSTPDESEDEGAPAEASEAKGSPDEDPASASEVDGGLATKRVIEGCDPVVEARKYEDFVEKRALAILRWNNMAENAAKLKIPVYVNSVDEGAIALSILPIPMRAQYLSIWMSSGHIERGPGDTFLLDPCASWIAAWEATDSAADDNDDP